MTVACKQNSGAIETKLIKKKIPFIDLLNKKYVLS